jgi:hypothetical protein
MSVEALRHTRNTITTKKSIRRHSVLASLCRSTTRLTWSFLLVAQGGYARSTKLDIKLNYNKSHISSQP